LHFGNRGFKLFKDANIGQLVGLSLPYEVECCEEDRANLRTLVSLIKKAEIVHLDRLPVTIDVLTIILDNYAQFPKLAGLHIEFDEKYEKEISRVATTIAPLLRHLSLVESIVNQNPALMFHVARTILQETCSLEVLVIAPQRSNVEYMEVVIEAAAQDKL